MKPYPLANDLLRPLLQVAMPRADARDPPRDQAARRGERRVPDPLSPPTRETKKCSRASANSGPWRLKCVQYLLDRKSR